MKDESSLEHSPCVSVIVPVFGVECFIERCARSLFEQTLNDIEFIFVNDCTNDNSISVLLKVLKEYPSRESQTVILHHDVNKGLPIARQTGLSHARGDYIAHCDSDDWVDKDMYRRLYERAISDGADIVVCDYSKSDGINHNNYVGCIHTDLDSFICDCGSMHVSWALWNKLVRSELYQNSLVYPTENMGEDMALVLQLLLSARTISYIPEPLYYYYVNLTSITQARSLKSIEMRFNQNKDNADIVINAFSSLGKNNRFKDMLEVIKWNVRKQIWSIANFQHYRSLWMNTYPEISPTLLFNRYISFSDKCKFVLTYLRLYPKKRL